MLGDDLPNEKARTLIESFKDIISDLNLEIDGLLGVCDDLRDEVRSLEEKMMEENSNENGLPSQRS